MSDGEDRQSPDEEGAFVAEYAAEWNKTQAAIRAGYSEDTARYMGYELLM
jgi:phage terminase small subunit